ncbi:MAG: lysophospholipase [Deltaproteobacteria bacterium]|nr:lysophospholipase [Deltaproteobacteria bacterium]
MDEQHTFLTSQDGTRIHTVTCGSSDAPKGELLVLGGLADHAGRYRHVSERCVEAGFRVTIAEPRGHGDSEGRRGHVSRWSLYGDDLRVVLGSLPRPAWILAHSMGGLIALDVVRDPLPRSPLGLVCTNPLLGLALTPQRWKTSLSSLLSVLLPILPLGNEIDPEVLSHDRAIVEAYETDPKVFRTVTPRWFVEMRAAQERVLSDPGRIALPLLMVTSDADRLCASEVARTFASRVRGAAQRHYPGLYHEVLNEPEKDAVLDDILSWFVTHAPTELR